MSRVRYTECSDFSVHRGAFSPVGTVVTFPADKSSQVVKVITKLHRVPRLRRRGAIPPQSYVLAFNVILRNDKKICYQ
jgi:hypothetical protein